MTSERTFAHRKLVSTLIESLLNEEISARTALNSWPTYCNSDPSIQCAYTMLWFFEADEDRHQEELYYPDVQIERLQQVVEYLKQGKPLPSQILHLYKNVQAPPEYNDNNVLWSPFSHWTKALKQLAHIVRSHPLLQKRH